VGQCRRATNTNVAKVSQGVLPVGNSVVAARTVRFLHCGVNQSVSHRQAMRVRELGSLLSFCNLFALTGVSLRLPCICCAMSILVQRFLD